MVTQHLNRTDKALDIPVCHLFDRYVSEPCEHGTLFDSGVPGYAKNDIKQDVPRGGLSLGKTSCVSGFDHDDVRFSEIFMARFFLLSRQYRGTNINKILNVLPVQRGLVPLGRRGIEGAV